MNNHILAPGCATIQIDRLDYRISERALYLERECDASDYKSFETRQSFYDFVTNIRLQEALERAWSRPPGWLLPEPTWHQEPRLYIACQEFIPNEERLILEHPHDLALTRQFDSRSEYYEFLASLNLRLLTESDNSEFVDWKMRAKSAEVI